MNKRKLRLEELENFTEAFSIFARQVGGSLAVIRSYVSSPIHSEKGDVMQNQLQRIDNATLQMTKVVGNWYSVRANGKKA